MFNRLFFIWTFIAVIFFANHAHSYPKSWWEPVDRKTAKSWEILPQDAKESDGEVILSKRTELGILSNFSPTPFKLDGTTYASLEGFWQMMKYPDPYDKTDPRNNRNLEWKYTRRQVAKLSMFEAKRAGDATKENYKKLGINWVSYQGKRMAYKGKDKVAHSKLIQRASWAKISQNKEARDILLATKGLNLKPDHHQKPDVPPAYRYFSILMDIRDSLASFKTSQK